MPQKLHYESKDFSNFFFFWGGGGGGGEMAKFQTKAQASSKVNFIQEIRWTALEQEICALSGRLQDKNVWGYRKYPPRYAGGKY